MAYGNSQTVSRSGANVNSLKPKVWKGPSPRFNNIKKKFQCSSLDPVTVLVY